MTKWGQHYLVNKTGHLCSVETIKDPLHKKHALCHYCLTRTCIYHHPQLPGSSVFEESIIEPWKKCHWYLTPFRGVCQQPFILSRLNSWISPHLGQKGIPHKSHKAHFCSDSQDCNMQILLCSQHSLFITFTCKPKFESEANISSPPKRV